MQPAEAEKIAVKVFGEGSKVVREGSWCRVLDPTGKEVGKGESWKSALQMACQPLLAADRKRREEHEAALNKERELFGDFLTALYHAFKAGKALEFLNTAVSTPADPTQQELPLVTAADPDPAPLVALK